MIFFMVGIVPSSNMTTALNGIQNLLFKKFKQIPAPFPLLITSISKNKPMRPTRKKILESYPEILTPGKYHISENQLLLKIEETYPLYLEDEYRQLNIQKNMGLIMSTAYDFTEDLIQKIPTENIRSFSNFSLSCYEIETENTELFWCHMNWNKIWEVKKGKKKI